MTNGQKILALFPDAKFYNAMPFTDGRWETINLDTENSVRATYKPTQLRTYSEWWNAEYKEPTTKNDLGVECIPRVKVIDYLCKHCPDDGECFKDCDEIKHLRKMPSVTPQEPQSFKWCTDCKEYDQEKHCCHRWSKVIRDTVEEMKQEQEPMLDKMRADIEQITDTMGVSYNQYVSKIDVLQIIDKYRESEGEE